MKDDVAHRGAPSPRWEAQIGRCLEWQSRPVHETNKACQWPRILAMVLRNRRLLFTSRPTKSTAGFTVASISASRQLIRRKSTASEVGNISARARCHPGCGINSVISKARIYVPCSLHPVATGIITTPLARVLSEPRTVLRLLGSIISIVSRPPSRLAHARARPVEQLSPRQDPRCWRV